MENKWVPETAARHKFILYFFFFFLNGWTLARCMQLHAAYKGCKYGMLLMSTLYDPVRVMHHYKPSSYKA